MLMTVMVLIASMAQLPGLNQETLSLPRIRNMSSVRLLTALRFYTCLFAISASIPSFLIALPLHVQQNRSTMMQCMTCTSSAISVACERSGVTCGQLGTALRSTNSGHVLHNPTALDTGVQPWLLKIFGVI